MKLISYQVCSSLISNCANIPRDGVWMSIKAAVFILQYLINSVGSNLLEFGEAFGKTACVLPRLIPLCLHKLLICSILICKFGLFYRDISQNFMRVIKEKYLEIMIKSF